MHREKMIKELSLNPLFLAKEREALEQELSEHLWLKEILHENEELLTRILEAHFEGILIQDKEGRIIFANAAAEKIYDLPRSLLTQRTYKDPAWKMTTVDGKPFPDENHAFARVLRTGEPVYDVEHAVERPDGTRVILSLNAAPLRNATYAVVGVISSLTDITQRKLLEKALRSSTVALERSNRELQDFIAAASQDLQEPLRKILTFGDRFKTNYATVLDDQGREYLERMQNAARQMQYLMEDLRQYSTSPSKTPDHPDHLNLPSKDTDATWTNKE